MRKSVKIAWLPLCWDDRRLRELGEPGAGNAGFDAMPFPPTARLNPPLQRRQASSLVPNVNGAQLRQVSNADLGAETGKQISQIDGSRLRREDGRHGCRKHSHEIVGAPSTSDEP